jgi:hypothetical protein
LRGGRQGDEGERGPPENFEEGRSLEEKKIRKRRGKGVRGRKQFLPSEEPQRMSK